MVDRHGAGADQSRPFFARLYVAMAPRMEAGGLASLREELLAGLTGRVVEVGCGNGLNFHHYPAAVVAVHAVEPEPYLRELAVREAERSTTEIAVTGGTASSLPLEDGSVDAAVLSLVLCSVPDPTAAIAELMRVVRPGGALVFLEHHLSAQPGFRWFQRVADATFWPPLAGGCRLGRDPLKAIRDGGFVVEMAGAPENPGGLGGALAPHILGRATRP